MENNEFLEAERQRQEIIKKIQEKERLLELLKSKHVKGGLDEIKEFQKKYNLKQIHKKETEEFKLQEKEEKPESKEHEIPQEKNIELNNEELLKKTLFSIKFQKAYRRYILKKKRFFKIFIFK